MADSGERPATEKRINGDEVAMPNLVLVLSQNRLALFWERRPAAPMYGTEPAVKPVERVVMVDDEERRSLIVTCPLTVARVLEAAFSPPLRKVM